MKSLSPPDDDVGVDVGVGERHLEGVEREVDVGSVLVAARREVALHELRGVLRQRAAVVAGTGPVAIGDLRDDLTALFQRFEDDADVELGAECALDPDLDIVEIDEYRELESCVWQVLPVFLVSPVWWHDEFCSAASRQSGAAARRACVFRRRPDPPPSCPGHRRLHPERRGLRNRGVCSSVPRRPRTAGAARTVDCAAGAPPRRAVRQGRRRVARAAAIQHQIIPEPRGSAGLKADGAFRPGTPAILAPAGGRVSFVLAPAFRLLLSLARGALRLRAFPIQVRAPARPRRRLVVACPATSGGGHPHAPDRPPAGCHERRLGI